LPLKSVWRIKLYRNMGFQNGVTGETTFFPTNLQVGFRTTELIDNLLIVKGLMRRRSASRCKNPSKNRGFRWLFKMESSRVEVNFEFCICILPNLCYRVFIPVVRRLKPPPAGSSLRHWPPGTNSFNVRAVFFCAGDFPVPQIRTLPCTATR
jgi:hypothetical protein